MGSYLMTMRANACLWLIGLTVLTSYPRASLSTQGPRDLIAEFEKQVFALMDLKNGDQGLVGLEGVDPLVQNIMEMFQRIEKLEISKEDGKKLEALKKSLLNNF